MHYNVSVNLASCTLTTRVSESWCDLCLSFWFSYNLSEYIFLTVNFYLIANWFGNVFASLQGDKTAELMPPTPPPRRVRLGLGGGCMSATATPTSTPTPSTAPVPTVPVAAQQAPSFNRIASGLKLAQAQAMAVAGFLPEPEPSLGFGDSSLPLGRLHPSVSDSEGYSRHAHCAVLNYRASFHGRG